MTAVRVFCHGIRIGTGDASGLGMRTGSYQGRGGALVRAGGSARGRVRSSRLGCLSVKSGRQRVDAVDRVRGRAQGPQAMRAGRIGATTVRRRGLDRNDRGGFTLGAY